jgi:energy-converting hydrogenase Eha subunit E
MGPIGALFVVIGVLGFLVGNAFSSSDISDLIRIGCGCLAVVGVLLIFEAPNKLRREVKK